MHHVKGWAYKSARLTCPPPQAPRFDFGGPLQAWDAPHAEDIMLNGTLKSANCGILVRITASTTHIAAYYAKAVNYTLMITAVSFLQVIRLAL